MTPIIDLKNKMAEVAVCADAAVWHQLIGLLSMGATTDSQFRMTVRHMVNVLAHIHGRWNVGESIPDVVVNPFPTIWKLETVESLPFAAYISFDLVPESHDVVGFLCSVVDQIGHIVRAPKFILSVQQDAEAIVKKHETERNKEISWLLKKSFQVG